MSINRVFFRFAAALLITALGSLSTPAPALARAQIIAVVTFRSTNAVHGNAVAASKALAARLAQEPGWDAVALDAHGKSAADAAAAIGAELYVIGQYLPGAPARITGATYRVATDERVADFSFALAGAAKIPSAVTFEQIAGTSSGENGSVRFQKPAPAAPTTVTIPSGELISVAILKDIGSRISQEGDTFAVETVEDYYYQGQLVLPKGSPGYGVITHLKRAGSFHAGGELNFTVKRLVTPSKTDLLVETNGATADADKTTEHNGNAFGQYLLWGVGMFAKRGNDILIKSGTTFHVSTLQDENVPVAPNNAQPAALDPAFAIGTAQVYAPEQAPEPASASLPAGGTIIAPPATWAEKQKLSGSTDVATIGYWTSPSAAADNLEVVTQSIPSGTTPDEFSQMTLRSLENAIGAKNVRVFRDERICNGSAEGWYIESSVTSGVTAVIAEQTLGLAGSQSYVATYRRPAGTPEDAAVRHALDTLCPLAE